MAKFGQLTNLLQCLPNSFLDFCTGHYYRAFRGTFSHLNDCGIRMPFGAIRLKAQSLSAGKFKLNMSHVKHRPD